MKKSEEWRTKPRSFSTGPPFSTWMAPALGGKQDRFLPLDHIELNEKLGKFDAARELIDDDAHRPFLRMRTDVDDGSGKARVGHGGHRDQHLPVEKTALLCAYRDNSWVMASMLRSQFRTDKKVPSPRSSRERCWPYRRRVGKRHP